MAVSSFACGHRASIFGAGRENVDERRCAYPTPNAAILIQSARSVGVLHVHERRRARVRVPPPLRLTTERRRTAGARVARLATG
jgi:hypothetical protein